MVLGFGVLDFCLWFGLLLILGLLRLICVGWLGVLLLICGVFDCLIYFMVVNSVDCV